MDNASVDEHAISGELLDDQYHQIAAYLTKRFVADWPCELCRNVDWGINHKVVSPEFLNITKQGFSRDSAIVHPSLHLMCTNCGNSKFMSLQVLGIDLSNNTVVFTKEGGSDE